jgi:two-component system, response regulator
MANSDGRFYKRQFHKKLQLSKFCFSSRELGKYLSLRTGIYADRDPREMHHVVLMDLNLPKVGGLEVLRRIRADKRTRILPVVILTSSEEEKDLAGGYNIGANSYVRKPVDFNEFMKAVEYLGIYWLELNHAPPLDNG